MKHKEYAAGVLTGVLVVTLAAGGVKFVQQRQYNGDSFGFFTCTENRISGENDRSGISW